MNHLAPVMERLLLGGLALALIALAVVIGILLHTERRRRVVRQELSDSERRLRLMMDAAPELISYVDDQLRYRLNNRAYEVWFGHGAEEYRGMHVREVLGEPGFERVRPHIEAALAGQQVTFEAEIPYRDGGTRFIEARYSPDFRPDGSVAGFHACVSDISRHKQIQAEVDARSRQFETLLNEAPLGVYLVDADFRIQQLNPVAEPVFRSIPGGARGRDFAEVVRLLWGAEFADDILRMFRHTFATGEPHHEAERAMVREQTGITEYYQWDVDRITLPDGRHGVVCYFRDISDDVNAREMIAHSEARYRTLFSSIEEGFCEIGIVLDANGTPVDYRFLVMNPAFERHTGMVDAVGRTVREIVPDIEHSWIERYGRVALTGEPTRFEEHSPALGRWFDVEAFPCGEPEERRVALLFRNTTDRNAAEQALREADRRKDEFLATLAHELRNPIAAIRMAMAVLGRVGADPGRVADMVAIIERQSSQLVRLTDDLLDVSRIARGKVRLERAHVDLVEIVDQVLSVSLMECNERSIGTVVDVPREAVRVFADPIRLAQVLNNLMHNACKFTPEGGEIRISLVEQAGEAIVRVRDTGVGIAPDQLDHVFEMFYQLESSSGNATAGLGIGLSLARSIIEQHDGVIEAHSDGIGKGSEFEIRLPILREDVARTGRPEFAVLAADIAVADDAVADDPAANIAVADDAVADVAVPDGTVADGATGSAPQRDSSRRIVAADDNQDALRAVELLLRMQGHRVEIAVDGIEALTKLRLQRPEVALLDIGMPGMDGYDVARSVRREPWGRNMLLIAMTGWGQERDKQRARAAGFDEHLTKPVDPEKLERLLARRPRE